MYYRVHVHVDDQENGYHRLFEDFLYPSLLQIRDKDVNSKEMKQALIGHFNLSEEDCALMTKSGSLHDRVNVGVSTKCVYEIKLIDSDNFKSKEFQYDKYLKRRSKAFR